MQTNQNQKLSGFGAPTLTPAATPRRARRLRARDAIPNKIYQDLLTSCNLTRFTGQREYLIYFFLWHSGLRVGELAHLKKRHVDDFIHRGYADIYEPKTKSTKRVFISASAVT